MRRSARRADGSGLGKVVAATDEGHPPEEVACAGVEAAATALSHSGLRVRRGQIVCVSRLALGERRAELHAAGAIAVDMESAAAAESAPRFAVRLSMPWTRSRPLR